jgi:hypothetical protein
MRKKRFVIYYTDGEIYREHEDLLQLVMGGTVGGCIVGDRSTGLALDGDGEWARGRAVPGAWMTRVKIPSDKFGDPYVPEFAASRIGRLRHVEAVFGVVLAEPAPDEDGMVEFDIPAGNVEQMT